MALLNTFLKRELSNMMKNGIRLNVIGRIAELPTNVRKNLQDTMDKTAKNSNLLLSLALNYGARTELLDAVTSYISQNDVNNCGELEWSTFSKHLYTREMPDPDLIIRTSGEHRLSNFLLMQGAYAEIYFTDLCWPEFHKEDFLTGYPWIIRGVSVDMVLLESRLEDKRNQSSRDEKADH